MAFPKATNIGGGSKGKVIVPSSEGKHGIPPGATAGAKDAKGVNSPTLEGNKGAAAVKGGGGKPAPKD